MLENLRRLWTSGRQYGNNPGRDMRKGNEKSARLETKPWTLARLPLPVYR